MALLSRTIKLFLRSFKMLKEGVEWFAHNQPLYATTFNFGNKLKKQKRIILK